MMHELIARFDWLLTQDTLLAALLAGSLLMFFGTAILVPWLIVQLPADYFAARRHRPAPDRRPLRLVLLIVKNLAGGLLIVLGVLLLVLPGQGLLTIAAGVVLLDFPGKYTLERRVVAHPAVLRSINWLRRRARRAPLRLEDKPRRSS